MTRFDYGALVRVTVIFANSAGTAIDPTSVGFSYLADAVGTATSYTYSVSGISKGATGTYYVDISTSESAGHYAWRFFSTGGGQGSESGEFYVRRDPTA